jgi:hypothetical protein
LLRDEREFSSHPVVGLELSSSDLPSEKALIADNRGDFAGEWDCHLENGNIRQISMGPYSSTIQPSLIAIRSSVSFQNSRGRCADCVIANFEEEKGIEFTPSVTFEDWFLDP